jgi:hypothetical protein
MTKGQRDPLLKRAAFWIKIFGIILFDHAAVRTVTDGRSRRRGCSRAKYLGRQYCAPMMDPSYTVLW